MMADAEERLDLEDVLVQLGMGRYQYYILVLFGLALAYSNISSLSFVFTAADIDYKCLIPECNVVFDPYTLQHEGYSVQQSKCVLHPLKNRYNGTLPCDTNVFNTSITVPCTQWIYTQEETSIVSDFDIACSWEELSFVGTLNSIGHLVGLPMTSYLADKYGRKVTLVLGCLLSATCGLLRSYSTGYTYFLTCEFIGAVFVSGVYPSAFILGMELVSSTKRPLSGMIIGNFYPLGAMSMGLVAWIFKDWRLMLRIMYLPGFLFIVYIWLIPESMRWLQTKGRRQEEISIIKQIAKVNKKDLPKPVIQYINDHHFDNNITPKKSPSTVFSKVNSVFGSKEMVLRVIFCSYCWVAVILVFYGLSVTSVSLNGGNKYFSFILSNFIEIPAAIVTLPIMEIYSRRSSQSVIFILSSIACILCIFVPDGVSWLGIALNMVSKFMISISSCIIYIYTAEIFPTELRLSLHGLCSTVGRIGSMLAPQIPLLKIYLGDNAPTIVFSCVTLVASVAVLMLPETKDVTLPDTVREAEHVDLEYHSIP